MTQADYVLDVLGGETVFRGPRRSTLQSSERASGMACHTGHSNPYVGACS
jgi:hypothetical protein